MNTELERLIDFALADGRLTDEKKEILYRKAKELNVPLDEFEMVLEGKKYMRHKEILRQHSPTQETGTSKEGVNKTCPSCGIETLTFATTCSHCGHEYRNVEVAKSVREFLEKFEALDKEYAASHKDSMSRFKGAIADRVSGGDSIDARRKRLIANFPIPNMKEDILEFLAMAVPKAKVDSFPDRIIKIFSGKGGGSGGWSITEKLKQREYAVIWYEKCEQIIMKARFSMKDDKKTLNEVEYYAKQLGIR